MKRTTSGWKYCSWRQPGRCPADARSFRKEPVVGHLEVVGDGGEAMRYRAWSVCGGEDPGRRALDLNLPKGWSRSAGRDAGIRRSDSFVAS
jgi:hypothetical protein